jgi:DNA-cytosine methyltransferase
VELTHASFFSGVGGLDLGLERAGWKTVSFSEIGKYQSAVLAEHWPDIPNLGDILDLEHASGGWTQATLWSGGFPCQDLSRAGRRAGLYDEEGKLTRSGLAIAFLNLVERWRPPIILLENVPGLLTSNAGRDFASLVYILGDLRYGWAYRIFDAQFFGVPQRRKRVFICAVNLDAGFRENSASQILSVGTRCNRHPKKSTQKRSETAFGLGGSPDIAGSLTNRYYKGINTTLDDGAIALSPTPNTHRMRATDGMAGRLDDIPQVAATLNSGGNNGGFRTEPGEHLIPFVKKGRANSIGSVETWGTDIPMATLNEFDGSDVRATAAIVGSDIEEDPLLPIGVDSLRYRACGNGVVSQVAQWIGVRMANAVAENSEVC